MFSFLQHTRLHSKAVAKYINILQTKYSKRTEHELLKGTSIHLMLQFFSKNSPFTSFEKEIKVKLKKKNYKLGRKKKHRKNM
jgi:hypothetical protein